MTWKGKRGQRGGSVIHKEAGGGRAIDMGGEEEATAYKRPNTDIRFSRRGRFSSSFIDKPEIKRLESLMNSLTRLRKR